MDQTYRQGNYTMLVRRSATSGTMDLNEAVRYLRENARFRTTYDTLARFSGLEGGDKETLKKKLLECIVKTNPDVKQESMKKNLNNWLSGGNEISKSGAIQIAYALRLSSAQADLMLKQLNCDPLHWRDPEDIIWIFGLDRGMSYADTMKLYNELKEDGLLKAPATESTDTMTSLIRDEVNKIMNVAELRDFLVEAAPQLGKLHNTAFMMFEEFMDLLQHAGDYTPGSTQRKKDAKGKSLSSVVPEERSLTVREIIADNMFRSYVPRSSRVGKKQKGVEKTVMDVIQSNIRANWPDETTLSNMKARKTDVTRKVMILLFMATDGGQGDYSDLSIDADEEFQSMDARLDLMLADCGFEPLDARVPFDWMILYCMCADESIFIDLNVQGFLREVFGEKI